MITALEPIDSSRWSPRLAQHLLDRAGFGIPRSRVRTLADRSPEEAADAFVHVRDSDDSLPAPPEKDMPPEISRRELRRLTRDLPYEEKQDRRQEWRRKHRRAVRRTLRNWWVRRMIETGNPLREKLTLFWHGHFATSARKVRNAHYNLQLNQIFRRNAVGNVRELTRSVARSPAMLKYLDNDRSRKKDPNENWARELMELFTMGLGHYTEKDVKESARAFTGWTIQNGSFTFRKEWHDAGEKEFLGEKGSFDGDDVIDIIFEQPQTARFIVRKLWTFFVYPDPEKRIVDELAAFLRLTNYELRPVLKRMFRSRAFYSDRAIGSRVKSPVQFVVSLFGELKPDLDDDRKLRRMGNLMKTLGQRLFYPPDVSGWDGNRAWIDTNKLLHRYNTVTDFFHRHTPVDEMKARLKPADDKTLRDAVGQLERAFLAVPLDESQRKAVARELAGTDGLKQTFDLKTISKNQLQSAFQLLLSTAEYQLC